MPASFGLAAARLGHRNRGAGPALGEPAPRLRWPSLAVKVVNFLTAINRGDAAAGGGRGGGGGRGWGGAGGGWRGGGETRRRGDAAAVWRGGGVARRRG